MSSDEDMSGSESEYSYHSQSEDEGDYGGGAGEGKCNGATSNGEPYTVLSKHDLNRHKSEVRRPFVLSSSLSKVAAVLLLLPTAHEGWAEGWARGRGAVLTRDTIFPKRAQTCPSVPKRAHVCTGRCSPQL